MVSSIKAVSQIALGPRAELLVGKPQMMHLGQNHSMKRRQKSQTAMLLGITCYETILAGAGVIRVSLQVLPLRH